MKEWNDTMRLPEPELAEFYTFIIAYKTTNLSYSLVKNRLRFSYGGDNSPFAFLRTLEYNGMVATEKSPTAMEPFAPTEEVFAAWERTGQIAEALEAKIVVFQCPASFRPTEENKANKRAFFRSIGRRGEKPIACSTTSVYGMYPFRG